jgi:hypothetical protein
MLILRTFANAHLAQIEGYDDFEKEKPIGALLMAMQAVRLKFLCIYFYVIDSLRSGVHSKFGKTARNHSENLPRSRTITMATTSST